MYKITDIEENHLNEYDLSWTIFINGGGPDLSIFRKAEDDFFQINIWHIGDDHRVNESKWCDIFKDIFYEKYESFEDTLTAIENILLQYKK